MPTDSDDRLRTFAQEHKFRGKGPLCVALVVTQHARDQGLPLDADTLLTKRGGQVRGLSGPNVQAVLHRHGIAMVLAKEGGRTSRGSIENMRNYVAFLNGLRAEGAVDLEAVEKFWISLVRDFFAARPLTIKPDSARSLRAVVADVLAQAAERQADTTGMQYEGAVLQHLVGAKLDCALGEGKVDHPSSSTADAQLGRPGDFHLEDVTIHVTTAPGEAVIERCAANLDSGLRPILITLPKQVAVAQGLAENKRVGHRIDIFDVEQFVALNLYELADFAAAERRTAVGTLVKRYNEIVEEVETDPSLKIAIQ